MNTTHTPARPRSGTLEPLLAKLLTVATTISGAVILLGIGLTLAKSAHAPRVLLAGLVLLALTPVARVVCTLVVFTAQRAWIYVAACLLVLAVMVVGYFTAVH